MQKALNFVLGMVLGGLFGSALALLLTPVSGDALRMDIREYTRQVRQEMEDAASARRAELERELADLRGEVITD